MSTVAATDVVSNPYLSGIFEPVGTEMTLGELEIIGKIPDDLNGYYLRNGPDPVNADPATYHWFTGDGMVHAVYLSEGKARWYKNRWIRSERLATELGIVAAPGPRHSPFDSVNTNIASIAGRTYALVEGGSTPVQFSDDLEVQKFSNFEGTLKDSFAAHPHLDPLTGEQHAITYNARRPDVVHHVVIDSSGLVVREEPVAVEHGPSIHDCGLTARFVVILDLPVTFSLAAAMAGQSFPYRWNASHKPRVGLLPRDGKGGDVIWCEVPPAYVFHIMNAYDLSDGRVVVDVCAFDRMFDGDPAGVNAPIRGLERWTVDPATGKVDIHTIDRDAQEFPRPDERYLGQPYRYGFTVAFPRQDGEQTDASVGLYKHDLIERRREFHAFGSRRHAGEFVFTPRSPEAPEGDGWLLGFVLDEEADRSELVILDTDKFEAEPVARILLPHRIPPGFHGNWINQAAR